jgi:KDO2-lipid IV(A) lauroyltransferase
LQHWLEYAGWRLVAGLLRPLPRRGFIVLADGLGWLMYAVLRVRRTVNDEQLQLALGAERSAAELRRIGLRSWQNAVLTFFEFLQPNANAASRWDAFDVKEGYEEHVRPLLAQGAGIFLTAHIGNWEALSRLGAQGGFQIAAVAKPMHNPLVDRTIVENRRGVLGMEVISTSGSLKRIAVAVREGKWIAMLGDQDARRRGIFVPFFGKEASTAEGPAYFAWRLGIPMVPSFCVRNHDRYRTLKLINLAPIHADANAPREQETRRLTELHVAALERVVRRFPAEYFWLHRRWKTQPKKRKSGEAA